MTSTLEDLSLATLAEEAETAQLLVPRQPTTPGAVTPKQATGAHGAVAQDAAQTHDHIPWFAWAMLMTSSLHEVPTLTLTSWRLSLTSTIIFPAAAVSFYKLPKDQQMRILRHAPLLLLAGATLAAHFEAFVWGLMHTSLTHSLLFSGATPVIIAGATWLMRRPISTGELLGTGVGVAGAVILASGVSSDTQVTLAGDMVSVGSAACFAVYLAWGQRLRAFVPLFVYAWPVMSTAGFLLSLGAVIFNGVTLTGAGAHGLLGWIHSPYMPRLVFLAVFPGIIGHVGFNAVLKWINPLIVSLALMVEPVIGSLIGYAMGVVQPPSVLTYMGGAVLLAATGLVTVAAHQRQEAARAGAGAVKVPVLEVQQELVERHSSNELRV